MRASLQVDVLIIGAGSAGCATALALAASHSVALVEPRPDPVPRIGESLHPAAHRLLAGLGLLEAMASEPHSAWHANRALWGGAQVFEQDFLRHPDGPGWHLDRMRFDGWLRAAAGAHGAHLLATSMRSLHRDQAGWVVELQGSGVCNVAGRFLVDATGRRSSVARRLGARAVRDVPGRLIAGWAHLRASERPRAGVTMVEATAEGWWYAAPLPSGDCVLAFHTDSDLPQARMATASSDLLHRARNRTRILAGMLPGTATVVASGCVAADGRILWPCVGDAWLAVGDAAITVDPIAGRGLLHALDTGLAAASVIEHHLTGDASALNRYGELVTHLAASYVQRRRSCYAAERRFPAAEFWRRRQNDVHVAR